MANSAVLALAQLDGMQQLLMQSAAPVLAMTKYPSGERSVD